MSEKELVDWVETWGPLVTLASTVILAVITGWLAYLTKVMADSAREAAEHSRVAAEASLATVAAAEASVDVRFSAEPKIYSTAGEMRRAVEILQSGGLGAKDPITPDFFSTISTWRAIRLSCVGATVTVHGLRLVSATVQDRVAPDGDVTTTRSTTVHYDETLACVDELPRLYHAGESTEFTVPSRPAGEDLIEMTAMVSYSFGTGSIRDREVRWSKKREPKPRVDAQVLAPDVDPT